MKLHGLTGFVPPPAPLPRAVGAASLAPAAPLLPSEVVPPVRPTPERKGATQARTSPSDALAGSTRSPPIQPRSAASAPKASTGYYARGDLLDVSA